MGLKSDSISVRMSISFISSSHAWGLFMENKLTLFPVFFPASCHWKWQKAGKGHPISFLCANKKSASAPKNSKRNGGNGGAIIIYAACLRFVKFMCCEYLNMLEKRGLEFFLIYLEQTLPDKVWKVGWICGCAANLFLGSQVVALKVG